MSVHIFFSNSVRTTFRQDRLNNWIGGGVLISLKSTSFKDVSILSDEADVADELEMLTLLCTTHLNQKLILCCCYSTVLSWY